MDDKKEEIIEQKTEEEIKEDPVKDNDKGSEPKATSLIEQANSAAERMEKANEEARRLAEKNEALAVRIAVGGRSEAGALPVKEIPLTDEEYTDKFMKGKVNPLEEDGVKQRILTS